MKRRISVVVAVPLLTVALLAGCGGNYPRGDVTPSEGVDDVNGVNTSLTLEEAKKTATDVEQDIAAIVPTQYVASIEQKETGVLLSCDDERGYQWTGQTRVILQGDPDPAPVVDAITAEYSERQSFSAEVRENAIGEPSASVVGEYGSGYQVSRSADGTAIEILSFSPCFVLPDGVSPRGDY